MRCKIAVLVMVLLLLGSVYAQEEGEDARNGSAFLAVALAVGLPALAAGFAISVIGVAAVPAIKEKPEIASWVIILAALAEGLALYGLVIGFMLVGAL